MAGASAAAPWDRLASDIQVLKQQALATQKSIQQLQTREPTGALLSLQPTLPQIPAGWDGTVVGVSATLALTLVLAWWYLWHRPQSRLRETVDIPLDDHSNLARLRRISEAGHLGQASAAPAAAPDASGANSLFAPHDPNLGFDSEAAASEVMRVRKSLAEKREARAHLREPDDEAPPASDVRDWLDQDRAAALDGLQVTSGPVPITAAPAPQAPPQQRALGPEPVPPAPTPVVHPDTDTDMDLDLDLGLDDPSPNLAPPPEAVTGEPHLDFSITLALAQESEALDLWSEARELANEVMDSHDGDLRAQAQALLDRLDAREQALARDTLPPAEPAQGESDA